MARHSTALLQIAALEVSRMSRQVLKDKEGIVTSASGKQIKETSDR